MCGICGIYHRGDNPVSEESIRDMREIMAARGPDDAGIHIGKHIGLGHRRLSIIDLSKAGSQPMSNEDGTVWMVFNGEIYNFAGLKTQLKERGHSFKSKTDSEVIIHGYEEWGQAVFEKLNGAFSIAIWDAPKERLTLARDRIGKKPLFYAERDGSVIFASDIKSLLTHVKNAEVDEDGIDCYLAHLCVPQAHTIFKGIKKVRPASYLTFDKNATRSTRYWYLSFRDKSAMDLNQCLEETANLLNTSIRDRMASDVPMGAFLSGGVDSSLVVAFLSRLSARRIKTFSIGFEDRLYDELPFAKNVADRFGTEHHAFTLGADYLDVLPRLVWEYGEPFADPSAVPSYHISKMAHEYIKVALVGDGGDESFAGYDRTLSVFRALVYKKTVPFFVISGVMAPILGRLGHGAKNFYPLDRMKYYTDFVIAGTRARYKNQMGFLCHREKLYTPHFKERLARHHPAHVHEGFYDQADGVDDVDRALYVDFHAILPDSYQVKTDVASMSHALEVRAPFLDYRLIEFAARMPLRHKMRGGRPKYILKKIAEKYVPRENIYRKKQGFDIPIDLWFKRQIKPYVHGIILSDRAKRRGYLDHDYVRCLVNEHLQGKSSHERRLWALLCFELWQRMFIDKDLKPTDPLSGIC